MAAKPSIPEAQESEGIEVHLSHEHMQKLGMREPPKPGTKVSLEARGHVSSASTERVDGKPRHHMRVTLMRGDLKAADDADARRKDLRGDIEAAAEKGGR